MKLPFPNNPDGFCLPYALANLFNTSELITAGEELAKTMRAPQWDIYHTNLLLTTSIEQTVYFDTFIARHPLIPKSEFKRSIIIDQLAAHRSENGNNQAVILFEVSQNIYSTHSVILVVDIDSGMATVIDPAKTQTRRIYAETIFDYYNVQKVAVMKNSVDSVALFKEETFGHLIKKLTIVEHGK